MNFLADESVDFPIIRLLRENGFTVKSILEDHQGEPDDFVLNLAARERLILITCDKDFGELIFRQKMTHVGVILLRLESLNLVDKSHLVVSAINQHREEFPNSFTVVSEKFIRIRK